MESLRSAKGPGDLQQKGLLLVKKVENIREENQRRIQDHINFLRQEIEAALAKVIALMYFGIYQQIPTHLTYFSETCNGK